ncbi:MAG: type II toxin-antitoxin system VapC family toxin [Acidimicrobiales bacterium]
MVWYLDTSAFLKLVVVEEETAAMRRWFASHLPVWSSQLLQTEARRAGTRLGLAPTVVDEALDAVSLVLPTAGTFFLAGRLAPPELRSLDALHLAAAVELGDDLDGMVAYDDRLAAAARTRSITVVAPA